MKQKIISFLVSLLGLCTLSLISCSSPQVSLVPIPGTNLQMSRTEITQAQFTRVMGINPSKFIGKNLPVGNVSWNDAIFFCNILSLEQNLVPVYSINGSKNPKDWDYTPCTDQQLYKDIVIDYDASGYRLPTRDEWNYCAAGGLDVVFSGADELEDIAWYSKNSGGHPHPVAQKKPNAYGLYDMSGNIWEWTDTIPWQHQRNFKGGSYKFMTMYARLDSNNISTHPFCRAPDMGFRICKKTTAP